MGRVDASFGSTPGTGYGGERHGERPADSPASAATLGGVYAVAMTEGAAAEGVGAAGSVGVYDVDSLPSIGSTPPVVTAMGGNPGVTSHPRRSTMRAGDEREDAEKGRDRGRGDSDGEVGGEARLPGSAGGAQGWLSRIASGGGGSGVGGGVSGQKRNPGLSVAAMGIRPGTLLVCFIVGLTAGLLWLDGAHKGVWPLLSDLHAFRQGDVVALSPAALRQERLAEAGARREAEAGEDRARGAVLLAGGGGDAGSSSSSRFSSGSGSGSSSLLDQIPSSSLSSSFPSDSASSLTTLRVPPAAESAHCSAYHRVDARTGEETAGGVRPLLIIVTPTYVRPFQAMYLHRLANLLAQVPPPLLWLVVEIYPQSAESAALLRGTGLVYRHLVAHKNMTDIKDRGVHQRNAAMEHVEKHRLDGIMYFADDDNIYSLELFEEMRRIKRFGTWPVAMLQQGKSRATLEGPVCEAGKVIGWHTNEKSRRVRRFHVDMCGFAFNSTILWNPSLWRRPTDQPIRQLDSVKEGFQETTFIEQLVADESQMEALADDCSQVLVWHVHLEAPRISPFPHWSAPLVLPPILPARVPPAAAAATTAAGGAAAGGSTADSASGDGATSGALPK
ncbi:hypothetical protein CLOM_g4831 [Closterium sp. NIES-68]|nr:hypothetical protein CLOM_g4831 [Closterium sp. NIES-68]GJP75381.1 hypothetical protein CLOP_g5834 [Closterium sp. NIES-67]